jgi:hypothetical protein
VPDRCELATCRADADLSYLGHGVCSRHWADLTNENAPADALRKALGIVAAPEPSMEDVMSSKKKVETKTDAKPEKAAKKREPKPDKSELRTVAVRVDQAEFDLLHKAAGPRNLSMFIKSTILTAATKALAK